VNGYLKLLVSYSFSPSIVIATSDGTGQINQAGIDHYNKLIDVLLAKGEERPCKQIMYKKMTRIPDR
jgi:hypothetical protein